VKGTEKGTSDGLKKKKLPMLSQKARITVHVQKSVFEQKGLPFVNSKKYSHHI
jgi:hypothetical protein